MPIDFSKPLRFVHDFVGEVHLLGHYTLNGKRIALVNCEGGGQSLLLITADGLVKQMAIIGQGPSVENVPEGPKVNVQYFNVYDDGGTGVLCSSKEIADGKSEVVENHIGGTPKKRVACFRQTTTVYPNGPASVDTRQVSL